ncbi:MAG: hypothetical protein AB1531_11950, partial [Chloroflexota bacterium]
AGYFASPRDDILLRNFATPGVRNALRTTLNRLWLQPLVHTDPDVVYFRSRMNALTGEQMSLLQDLAEVSHFKATSDIPTWLTKSEREALGRFLENRPRVQKTGRNLYHISDREVDFSPHINIPFLPRGLMNLQGAILGWLAGSHLLMNIFDKIGRRSLKKTLKQNPV